ncbi:MAG: CopG family transcriptional regulator [Caldisphaera sp.]|uniref:ribbon-helix-helix protein, CopG family n=1 Tax=Caldisphaera sp. TaxID=2060322 RepID=UPI000CC15D60|nr:ribbon-helix-helix protein, CopG family [Caldisphaera sp.]PMP59582.1 MAG: CopG family transcriptional regulator [Caldisphaera sp.]PMP89325.1 MAG: CopG family transcriptional regulator [Caldisphaera sp.]
MSEFNKKVDELRIVSFRIDTDTLFKLDKITLKTKSNRSEVIRKAIEQYLKNEIK